MGDLTSTRYNTDSDDTAGLDTVSAGDVPPDGARQRAVMELYSEYRNCFKARNFQRIEKIIISITGIQPDSPVLSLIQGEALLYKGLCSKSRLSLQRFINRTREFDTYALNLIAMWNEAAGFHKIALLQYVECMRYATDAEACARLVFNATNSKKRLRFLDTSLSYYQRLLAIPDGFRLLPCIKIEMIHLHILKKNFSAAMREIEIYLRYGRCCFIDRLQAYVNYVQREFNEVLRHKNDGTVDPYIAYLIARIGLENPATDIDVAYYFDEAIKCAGGNAYIYNSYGNYYYSVRRYSDAAEQYSNALSADPRFQPAIDNMDLMMRANSAFPESIYVANTDGSTNVALKENDPDVEEMGFLNVWKFFGYAPFKKESNCIEELAPLQYHSE